MCVWCIVCVWLCRTAAIQKNNTTLTKNKPRNGIMMAECSRKTQTHTLYRDSVTLIQGHVFSVLLMFLFSKTILLLLLWQAERAMEEEVESWPWRGCSGLQRRVSIYAAGMRVCQRELKEERQMMRLAEVFVSLSFSNTLFSPPPVWRKEE